MFTAAAAGWTQTSSATNRLPVLGGGLAGTAPPILNIAPVPIPPRMLGPPANDGVLRNEIVVEPSPSGVPGVAPVLNRVPFDESLGVQPLPPEESDPTRVSWLGNVSTWGASVPGADDVADDAVPAAGDELASPMSPVLLIGGVAAAVMLLFFLKYAAGNR